MTTKQKDNLDETPIRAPFEGPPTQEPAPPSESGADEQWAPQSEESTATNVDDLEEER